MAFREVRVFEVREVLRLWLRGEGLRSIERLAGVDRKTVRRYVDAAVELGLVRDGGEEQLTDVFIGSVVEAVRPHRRDGHGEAWRLLVAEHDRIEAWLKTDGLTVVKVGELLARRGVVVPERTLHRYALEVCDVGRGRRGTTVRVADGEPGDELQVDFGRLGPVFDPETRPAAGVWALIFTPVVSPHSFVWLQLPPDRRRRDRRVRGGVGVLRRRVRDGRSPTTCKAIVDRADPLEPRLEPGVRRVRPGPRVRGRPGPGPVPAGQAAGGADGPVRAPVVLRRRDVHRPRRRATPGRASGAGQRAGMRIHGTIQARPAEVFARRGAAPCCGRPRPSATTCRSTRRRRSTATTTSRSPRRSTRSRGT